MSFSGMILFNHARALPCSFIDSLAAPIAVATDTSPIGATTEGVLDEVVETVAATNVGSRGRPAPRESTATGALCAIKVVGGKRALVSMTLILGGDTEVALCEGRRLAR